MTPHPLTRPLTTALAAILLATLSATAPATEINLNSATTKQLQSLPGIGPKRAADIIRLRNQNGGYTVLHELLAVPGIGVGKLRAAREFGLMLPADTAAELPKINLNTATAKAMRYIPGIGKSRAAQIVRLREANGGFTSIEDLLGVRGIGEETLIDISKYGSLNQGVSTLTREMKRNRPPKTPSFGAPG